MAPVAPPPPGYATVSKPDGQPLLNTADDPCVYAQRSYQQSAGLCFLTSDSKNYTASQAQ